MRNIVAHDYGNVNPKIIWEVATIHIPEVSSVIEKFFAGQKCQHTPAFARRLDASVCVRQTIARTMKSEISGALSCDFEFIE